MCAKQWKGCLAVSCTLILHHLVVIGNANKTLEAENHSICPEMPHVLMVTEMSHTSTDVCTG